MIETLQQTARCPKKSGIKKYLAMTLWMLVKTLDVVSGKPWRNLTVDKQGHDLHT
jgi:hypothetical protein